MRVVIAHSVGVGTIMLLCRRLENISDAKKLFTGYYLFSAFVLINAFYSEFFGQGGPPLPVFVLYIIGAVLGIIGALKKA